MRRYFYHKANEVGMQIYLEDAMAAAALLMAAAMLAVAGVSYLRTRHGRVLAPALVAASLFQFILSFGSDAPPQEWELSAAAAEIAAVAAVYAIWLLRGRGGE
jgi:hypothetical protein